MYQNLISRLESLSSNISSVILSNHSHLQLQYHAVMGWLPAWGSTTKPKGATSSDTINPEEYRPPGRQTRAKCWDSRDVFNECLNRNNILDAIKDKDAADNACRKESDLFEKNCASSWVRLACSCPKGVISPLLSTSFIMAFGSRSITGQGEIFLRPSSRNLAWDIHVHHVANMGIPPGRSS